MTFEQFKDAPDHTLYVFFQDIIITVLQKYDDIHFSERDRNFVIKRSFDACIKRINEENFKKVKHYFGVILEKSILKYVKDHFQTSEELTAFISTYIKTHLSLEKAPLKAIKELEKIELLLNKYHLEYPFELYEFLLKDPVVASLIEVIISGYIEKIQRDGLSSFVSNDFVIVLLELECQKRNIEIGKDNSFEMGLTANMSSIDLYKRDMERYPLLSVNEERVLCEKLLQGDTKAREKMIAHNLRLVFKIAAKYVKTGIPFEDLIGYGNLGLIKAVDFFDVRKGCKFSTYAFHWIRQAIGRAINNTGKLIRTPVYLSQKLVTFNRVYQDLKSTLYRDPTTRELALAMEIEEDEVLKLYHAQFDVISLEQSVDSHNSKEEKTTSLEYFIASKEDSIEEGYEKTALSKDLEKCIKKAQLSPRMENVLRLRYADEPWTLEDISVYYHVTRERIRQIEAKALKRLIYVAKKEGLSSYYGLSSNMETSEYKKISSTNRVPHKLTGTFYQLIDSKKEIVDSILDILEERARNLLHRFYGEDLEHPDYAPTEEEYREFYDTITIPICRELQKKGEKVRRVNYKPRKLKTLLEILDITNEAFQPWYETLTDYEKGLIRKREGDDLEHPSYENRLTTQEAKDFSYLTQHLKYHINKPLKAKNQKNMSPQESKAIAVEKGEEQSNKVPISMVENIPYQQFYPLVKKMILPFVLQGLSKKEACIVILALYGVDGRTFSVEEVSEFLQMPVSFVREMIMNALENSKVVINTLFHEAISQPSNVFLKEKRMYNISNS